MTIKIVAQDLRSDTTLRLIQLCNNLILEEKNYGSYTIENGKFSITLHLKKSYSNLIDMMDLLDKYITSFCCGPTEMTLEDSSKNIDTKEVILDEPIVTVENESEKSTETSAEPTVISNDIAEPEENPILEELDSKKDEHIDVIDAKQAVYLMFDDVSGKESVEEIADKVINRLNLNKLFYKKTISEISKMIKAYLKADTKPKSMNQLRSLNDFKVLSAQAAKINKAATATFTEKYGISVTFLQCLLYVSEKFPCNSSNVESSDDSENSKDPEEVILQPPEKPPDDEVVKPYKEPPNLLEFIQTLDPSSQLKVKVKQLVDFMGLQEFKKYNQATVERLFYSIISNKETNLNNLFELDSSLKKYSTARGSIMVLKKFIGNFFMMEIDEDFVIEFFKDLINNFSEYFSLKKSSESKFVFVKNNSEKSIKQTPGELYCFPKNEKFDTYIRKEIKYQRLRKTNKIRKILKYMGIAKLPSNNSKLIYKICCGLFVSNVEKLYPLPTIEIVERFINDFAKQLNPDAKFVTLQSFLNCLSSLP